MKSNMESSLVKENIAKIFNNFNTEQKKRASMLSEF